MAVGYIVDASIVMQYLITDTFTVNTTVLFKTYREPEQLFIPEFGILECVNVLWKQVRFHGMLPAQAENLITDLVVLPLTILPVESVYKAALQIGLKHQLAVYDSIYIALAVHLHFPLITVDAKQEQAAKLEGVTVKPITDFVP